MQQLAKHMFSKTVTQDPNQVVVLILMRKALNQEQRKKIMVVERHQEINNLEEVIKSTNDQIEIR